MRRESRTINTKMHLFAGSCKQKQMTARKSAGEKGEAEELIGVLLVDVI